MKDVIIVTGAATGIGLAAAKLLSQKNFVIATYCHTAPQEEVMKEMNGMYIQCDVSDYESCRHLIAEAQKHGAVKGLVHSAAINPSPAPSVLEMEPEFWERMMKNNLNSAFYLAKAVIPALQEAKGGSIVFISSTAGRNGFSTAGGTAGHAKTAYATSKAGIIAFTKGLAKELVEENIRVNCLAAGPINTRMLPNKEIVEQRVPMKRLGRPEEVAKAIEFLLNDATYTTGCTLDVCGGQYMN